MKEEPKVKNDLNFSITSEIENKNWNIRHLLNNSLAIIL
jgi:hypothetical protein